MVLNAPSFLLEEVIHRLKQGQKRKKERKGREKEKRKLRESRVPTLVDMVR